VTPLIGMHRVTLGSEAESPGTVPINGAVA
jgi:hypothetical protein